VKETAHEQRDLLLLCSDWIYVIALQYLPQPNFTRVSSIQQVRSVMQV